MVLNDTWIQNCMLDFGALVNVMTLKFMKKIGSKMTIPYGNVCGIDSKSIGYIF